MIVKVRYKLYYDENSSASYDIIANVQDLPDDQDWLYFFYERVNKEIIKIIYRIEFIDVQYL